MNSLSEKSSDQDLMAYHNQGDERAFLYLYNRYAKIIYRDILYMVKNEEVADSLLSSTFLKAWRAIEKIDKDSQSIRFWLKTIAQNECFDYFRNKKRERNFLFFEDINIYVESDNNREEEIITKEELDRVIEQRDKLFYRHRNILRERYEDGKSYKELAKKYNVAEGTIKRMLYNAKKALRKAYLQPE